MLVGNKTDLLEQQEATDEATEQDGQTEMTATLTRHPDQVPTTIAMQLAQVRSRLDHLIRWFYFISCSL